MKSPLFHAQVLKLLSLVSLCYEVSLMRSGHPQPPVLAKGYQHHFEASHKKLMMFPINCPLSKVQIGLIQ